MPGLLSDILAWVAIATFVAGVVANRRDRDLARRVMAAAWVVFALFWLQLIPHFTLVHKSYIEGILTIVAVPASLYTGWLLYSGRDSLFVLSRAVAAMGLVYLPFETIPALTLFGTTISAPRGILMESVAAQTNFLIESLGYSTTMIPGDEGYLNTFLWMQGSHRIEIAVVLACTGLGSIAIFAGLITAVDAPLRRKFRALAIAVPIIYALNLLRTTFITISVGKQYFHLFVDEILFLFGSSDPYLVSFFISDRIISQVLAVVALVGITYLVVREVPELLTVIEDILYMITGEEYDLRSELGVEGPNDPRA
ncbi:MULTISPECIES: archaeosortase A [Haloferax]|uniref:Archaeosortase A n=1 Tax=Haloferax marinum TaxID=2666143 RepID=A0A6A8G3U7_9EURY|nr:MULTISPECIES: archaeosortase A [Haloferax]KAB1196860.1 archaeosortase A [Haloferax sp. CBA1150]MRW95874.1 archaeosortase A [Haloferax marinum]